MPDHSLPDRLVATESRTVTPRRRWWPWVVLAAALACGAWFLWPPPPATTTASPAVAPEPPPALTVTLRPAERRSLARPVIGDGSVAAWQELVIGTESSGLRVLEAGFEPGDRVRAGQVLVRLDPSVPAATLASAEAAIGEAEAALRLAEAEVRRGNELQRSDIVARATVEQRLSVARQAEARVASARARREEAAVRLAQTRIVAPADGTISARSVLVGAVVQPGQEMFRLIRDDRLDLNVRVPELELARVRPGQPVRVLHGEREITAEVRAVFPTVEAATRLATVHVRLPPDAGLRPGQFARAEIQAGAAEALVVPQEAVVFREGRAIVFLVPEGTDRALLRPVTTGQRREGVVEVTQGLAAGDPVVVQGAGFLTEGDRVRVVAPR